MLKTSSNGTQATTAVKFALRLTAETLADLSRPIDPRHLKTRKQGSTTLTYCPWNTIARHLHHRAPGWCWEVQSVQEVGGAVVVTGRLTIPMLMEICFITRQCLPPLQGRKTPVCLRNAYSGLGVASDLAYADSALTVV
jgi:hypothetical protein